MSYAFRACLYRERRRLGLVTVLAFLAGVLFYWRSGAYVGGVHISLITGVVYASVVGAASIAICTLLPRLRFMMEAVAVSRLLLALFLLAYPGIGTILLGNPFLMALVIVGGGACISRLLHGQIERHPQRRFAFGPKTRQAVIARGTDWQRAFVSWVDGAAPVPVRVRA